METSKSDGDEREKCKTQKMNPTRAMVGYLVNEPLVLTHE
jgi:hypothetical protein